MQISSLDFRVTESKFLGLETSGLYVSKLTPLAIFINTKNLEILP